MASRAVRVRIDAQLLANMLFTTSPGVWWRTDRGLPPDAKCVGRGYDLERDCFWIYFEHPSFAETVDGEYLPIFDAFELSAVHFSSPIDDPQVAMINDLTAKQVERYEVEHAQPIAVVGP